MLKYIVTIVLLALGLIGCGEIAVEPQPTVAAPEVTSDYDLAVVSVDFEPALQGNRLPISATYAVLVAVENRGVLTARNVNVNASVTNVDTDVTGLRGSQALNELAPGAIKVVRIETSGALPPEFATYELTVQAQPLPTETIVSNNVREFVIRVAP